MLEKRYKIGFDAKRAFNNGTGLGNYSRFIIKALLEMAGSFDYFAFTPKVNAKFNFFLSEKNLQTRLPQISKFKFLWRSYFIVKELKKEGIDLFHGLSNELPYGLKKNNIKSVVTIHDLIFLHFPNHYPFFDRIIYRFKFKFAAQQADKIIAVSEQTKKDLVRFYDIAPSKIAVIYQDCDEAFKKIIPAQSILKTKEKYAVRQEYILCVGSIIERKNQLTLVKAFQKLNHDKVQLVLVGSKSAYQSEIEKYIQTHQLQNIQILNKVPFKDLPALYQGASVFVYPSIYEGFGIPILEALYSGVPVIAAKGSCLEETGGEAALYFEPKDTKQLSSLLTEILTDHDKSKKLLEESKEQLMNFLPQKIALKTQQVYNEVLF